MELILGTTSLRRQEIMGFFSLPFMVIPSDFDEDTLVFNGQNPREFATRMAKNKALSLVAKHPHSPILTADTIVFKDGLIYTKPKDGTKALLMLKELAGCRHEVYTGVAIAQGKKIWCGCERSSVWLNPLTDRQIALYHKSINFLDKAGAYAIQKNGCIIVKRIRGCYYNVMGLPVNTVRRLMLKIDIDLWEHL